MPVRQSFPEDQSLRRHQSASARPVDKCLLLLGKTGLGNPLPLRWPLSVRCGLPPVNRSAFTHTIKSLLVTGALAAAALRDGKVEGASGGDDSVSAYRLPAFSQSEFGPFDRRHQFLCITVGSGRIATPCASHRLPSERTDAGYRLRSPRAL
ncbi:hypothetical protein SKAU_G00339130 [Synaphobranchus kaupii]|uniref:Uncharacterized protein n=1 Tax=Synaphobranchus kaupii TaxID=118154 RepID=A0A9Q1EMP4_SYNKA|nr:hypothetical protein SKAU_G00339130 [Synaphobranchus kaupii]